MTRVRRMLKQRAQQHLAALDALAKNTEHVHA